MGQEQDSLALKYYDKSLQSPLVDSSARRVNYRKLADYYFLKGVRKNRSIPGQSVEIPEQGRLNKHST